MLSHGNSPPTGRLARAVLDGHPWVFFLGTLLPAVLVSLSFLLPSTWTWQAPRFDSVLDSFFACISFTVATVMLLYRERNGETDSYLYIASGLYLGGLLQLIRSSTEFVRAVIWLHRVEIVFPALFFYLAWLPSSILPAGRQRRRLAFLTFGLCVISGVLILGFPAHLPRMVTGNAFSPISDTICLAGGILYLGAALLRGQSIRGVDDSETVFLNLCFFYGVFGCALPFSRLWGPRWWTLEIIQFIPYFIAFGYVFALVRATQRALVERTEQLARSNRDLENFAYVASHDLQEPLRMVTSYVQLIARHSQGKLGPEVDEFIRFAIEGAQRMSRLIRELLEYSRLDQSARPTEPVDCNKVLERVVSNLSLALNESGGAVTWEKLPTLLAHPSQMERLFQNLFSNAIKYRGTRSPDIRIRADWEPNQRVWVFSVQDNGIGFEMKDAERIFLLFHRLHGRGEYPGTGIGLATCRRIVEQYGGKIWATSKPGEGSVFHFSIPAADSALAKSKWRRFFAPVEARTLP